MKKAYLMTAFIALALSTPAFAVNMDYNSDTDTGVDNNTTLNSNAMTDTTGTTATGVMHHRHHRKKTSSTYRSSARHPNAGALPSGSVDMNDNATSRQGMPSGETNGPVNGQSDDQNYGQPTNH